jgi:tRNA(Ile)-lysidine synthase TilS/MesJ
MKIYFLFINTINCKQKYILVYSGGYDSTYMLNKICKSLKCYEYVIAHFIHNQRHDATLEIIDILLLCINFNLTCAMANNDLLLQTYAKLRKKRYIFLYSLAKTLNINNIILCHNLSDNLENLFMKMDFNISYTELLMPERSYIVYLGHDICILRPIIHIARSDIEFCNTPLVNDYQNDDHNKKRSCIRKIFHTKNITEETKDLLLILMKIAQTYQDNKFRYLKYTWSKHSVSFNIKNNLSTDIKNIKNATFILNNQINHRIKYQTLCNIAFNKQSCCINECSIVIIDKKEIKVTKTKNYLTIIKYCNFFYEIQINNFAYITVKSNFNINITKNNKYEIIITNNDYKYRINIKYLFYIVIICYLDIYIIISLYTSKYTLLTY